MPSENDYCLTECKSCGELISHQKTGTDYELQDCMRAYCRDCAEEILGREVGVGSPHTFNFDTGGGKRVIKETKTH